MNQKRSKKRSKNALILPEFKLEQSQQIDITANGGLFLLAEFAKKIGIFEQLANLKIFKRQKITEAVHVFALVLNQFTGGAAISDTINLRTDNALRTLFGDIHIPAQNTSAEFLERFTKTACEKLREIMHQLQQNYLKKLSKRLNRRIVISLDSSIYEVFGNYIENTALSFKKIFGFHPLLLHVHHTGELLDIILRPGGRFTSQAADELLKAAIRRLKPYFDEIILLADAGFYEQTIIDVCEEENIKIKFIITSELNAPIRRQLTPTTRGWNPYTPVVAAALRKTRVTNNFNYRLANLKERLAKQGKVLKLRGPVEWTEFNHTVAAWKRNYRFVYKRQLILKQDPTPQQDLFAATEEYFYHGDVTNIYDRSAAELIDLIDSRGNQENFIKDFKNGLETVHLPSKHFYGNYAYFLISMLSWNLKCWMLSEIDPAIKIGWKRFRYLFVKIGAQIVKSGGYVKIRLGKGFGRLVEFSRWFARLHALPSAT